MSSESDDSAHAHGPSLSRRGLLKGTAAGGAAVVGLGAGDAIPGDVSPVGEAEAIGCGGLCIGAVAVGGAAAAGWLLRDQQVVGSNPPADGLTSNVLLQETYSTARTRQSTNRSTFVDNQNILDTGFIDSLYSEGKLAAIQAINNTLSESEVTAKAHAAADAHATTVLTNLFKSWNESVNELQTMQQAVADHPDITLDTQIVAGYTDTSDADWDDVPTYTTFDYTMPDGTLFTMNEVVGYEGTSVAPTKFGTNHDQVYVEIQDPDGMPHLRYLNRGGWKPITDKILQAVTDTKNNLSTWVSNVYSKVQSGDLDTAELLTSTEMAALGTDATEAKQAMSDLVSLNIPVNFDREAEIKMTNYGTTMYGKISTTGNQTLSAGSTINPSTDSEDYYLTYDESEGHGTWTDVNDSVDGGTVTFTAEPHPGVLWSISTGAQETAEVASADFADNGDGTWSVDISGQVETAITTVAQVKFYSDSDTTNMQTVQLTETFEIVGFTDAEGNDVASADYSRPSPPQDDTNYITKSEWETREKKYEELIQEYEDSQSGGGGGLPSFGNFSPTQMVVGAVVLGGSIFGIGQLS